MPSKKKAHGSWIGSATKYEVLKITEESKERNTDTRLRFKREVGGEVRAYLNNLDAQVGRIRNRLVMIDAKLWPDASPEFSEPRNKLGDG